MARPRLPRQKNVSALKRSSSKRKLNEENSPEKSTSATFDILSQLTLPEKMGISNKKQIKRACLLACVALLAVNALSIPVPPNFKNPWILRVSLGLYKFYTWMHDVVEYSLDPDAKYLFFKNTFVTPPPPPEVWHLDTKMTDAIFDGVPVRIYEPTARDSKRRAVMLFHGGGWTLGSIKMYNPFCSSLSDAIDAVVVSVEYRLAPEHWFPDQFNDCTSAAMYFLKHASEYGVDPDRVAILGDSAGGNLAAAVNLKLRDISFRPKPKLQVLLYPALQAMDMLTPSYQKNALDPILSQRNMAGFWLLYAEGTINNLEAMIQNNHTSSQFKQSPNYLYLNHGNLPHRFIPQQYVPTGKDYGNDTLWDSLKSTIANPYFSPLLAEDLAELPRTLLMTMENDVLRDDGVFYVQRLRQAGNRVTHLHYESGFHGLVSYPIPLVEDCKIATEKIYKYLEKYL